MLRGRIATARPRWVLAAAWLWLVLYGFPGQMMPDTFEHLGEARSGVYTDGSPPVFTLLFAISDAISGGPLLLFLAQTTVFVAGAYMTLRRLVPRGAHWITLVLCAFPPVFTTLPIVWKDALMPGLLLCGAGCLLGGRRILALAALGLAISIRYNAFAAAFPLVVLLFEWRAGMHWLKRYAIAFAAWVGICTGAYTANDMLTDQPMHLWASSLALYDITGTLRFAPETLPDETLAPLLLETGLRFDKDIHAQLRARYRPGNFFNLVAGPNAAWDVPIYGYVPAPAKQRAAVSRAFSELVTTYPLAYLENRWGMWRECLALRRNRHAYWAVPSRTYEYPENARADGVNTYASRLQRWFERALNPLWRRSSLFEPSMYFLLSLLLLPFTRRHRPAFALLLSGIAVELTLFFLASSPDYRYSHWMVTTTCIATIALISQRMVAARGHDPALRRVTREDPVDPGSPRHVS